MNKTVLDYHGKPIVCQSVVGMSGDGPWSDYQGFVVAPHSDQEDDGYTVAIFFGTEVSVYRFNKDWTGIKNWDNGYEKFLVTGNYQFLLTNDLWKKCPRVVYFRPEELVVQEGWNYQTLAQRIFGDTYNRLYNLPNGISYNPSSYPCFLKDCNARATKTAMCNVWGSVVPLHVCDKCFTEVNGMCCDQLPDRKDIRIIIAMQEQAIAKE